MDNRLGRNVSFKQFNEIKGTPKLNSNISDLIRNDYLNKNNKLGSIIPE